MKKAKLDEDIEKFELSNGQRQFFGIDAIQPHWEKVRLEGRKNQTDRILYFEDDVIKRQILSTETEYFECQYDEKTRNREVLLPKTQRGKEQKLSISTLDARKPMGAYAKINSKGHLAIGNFTLERTFYQRYWDHDLGEKQYAIQELVDAFIAETGEGHFDKIKAFNSAEKQNNRFKPGDFFSFKTGLSQYGFGRIILDIHKLRKLKYIDMRHGLYWFMGRVVLVKVYAYKSNRQNIDIDELEHMSAFPSHYIADNNFCYGDYKIIGNKELAENDFDFPISYGRSMQDGKNAVSLQWGMLNLELPLHRFDKYLLAENLRVDIDHSARKKHEPYKFINTSFFPLYNSFSLKELDKIYDGGFSGLDSFSADFDLRNPVNEKIRNEIFAAFDLNFHKGYFYNSGRHKFADIRNIIDKTYT